jgi:hypothetical protein
MCLFKDTLLDMTADSGTLNSQSAGCKSCLNQADAARVFSL